MPLVARTCNSLFADPGVENPQQFTPTSAFRQGKGLGLKGASKMPLLKTLCFVSLVLLMGLGSVFFVKRVRLVPGPLKILFHRDPNPPEPLSSERIVRHCLSLYTWVPSDAV